MHEIQKHIDHLKQHWDRLTYDSLPQKIKDDPLFKKAINYLKLKYGSLSDPIMLDDDYYITQDIYQHRSRIIEVKTGEEKESSVDDFTQSTGLIFLDNHFYLYSKKDRFFYKGEITPDEEINIYK